jgi:hypothetical protein
MFACRFPKRFHLADYQSAQSLWDRCQKHRKGTSHFDSRSLFDRYRDNSQIILDTKGQISFRLYDTDVVVFDPDGTVILDPVATQSTRNFVHAILERGVYPLWTDRHANNPDKLTQVGDQVYHTPGFAALRWDTTGDSPEWTLVGGAEPMVRPGLDRSKSRQVLAQSGYHEFVAWLKAAITLGVDPRGSGRGPSTIDVPRLKDPAYYGNIVENWSGYQHVNDQLEILRRKVYQYYDAVSETEITSVHYNELPALLAAMRRYG